MPRVPVVVLLVVTLEVQIIKTCCKTDNSTTGGRIEADAGRR